MNDFFNNVLVNLSDEITVQSALITIGVSLLLGAVIAFTYYKTQNSEDYQRSMAMCLLMLPVILSVIIVFVGSNVARAFSLAGTLSIIRFRSTAGDAKDIAYIFFDIAAGLACGVGLFGYGALFVIILCGVMFLFEKKHIFERKQQRRLLKITVPENLCYEEAFEEVLDRYTESRSLEKIRTTELGSLFEVSYNIVLKNGVDVKGLIDELRCRNGNLTIVLSSPPKIIK